MGKNLVLVGLIWINTIFVFPQKIFINEFMAANSVTFADMVDYSDFADWIELYNDESKDIGLSGYYLTDDKSDTLKWQFPDNSIIKAKSFLIIWADGEDAVPGEEFERPFTGEDRITLYYHTNFKLGQEGERIALYDDKGVLLDKIKFDQQLDDVSYGRKPGGSGNWYYFASPKPGASNNTEGITNLQYTGIPQFSVEGGWFTASQTITLTTTTFLGQIRYTTDGSIPKLSSKLYTGPVTIDSTTVLKAR